MSVFKDTMCGMWRAEIEGEISPYCATRDEAEEAEAMLEDGLIWRDGAWVESIRCEFCEELASAEEAIHTEDGSTVGECCHDELRVKEYKSNHGSEVYYYAN